MKREYQSVVHFHKENRANIKLGIAVLLFILGLVMLGSRFQANSIRVGFKWFCRYAYAGGLVIACLLIFGLICSFGMDHELAFAIDSNNQGIWLYSMRSYQLIYIPFSMLEITCNRGILTFKYQNAFCYKKNHKIRMLSKGMERIRVAAVYEEELKGFIANFNQLTSKERALDLSDVSTDQSILKVESIVSRIFFLFGMFCILLFNPLTIAYFTGNSLPTQDSTFSEGASYFKNEDLQFNRAYSTKNMNIVINKGYQAQTTDGKQVVIFNITVTGKTDDANIDAGDFYLTSDKKIAKDGVEYAHNPMNATTLMVKGKSTPVVNQLNDDDNYGNPELHSGKKITFNVVLGLSDSKEPNYLVYTDFGFDYPDEYENKPAYIFKFDPQKLEVLE